MQTTTLRKVGGSIMLTVPSPLLAELRLSAGSMVALEIEGKTLIVKPSRRRYTAEELIAEYDASSPLTEEEREWLDEPPRWERADLMQGDIYLVSLDPTVGHEQRRARPCLDRLARHL